MAGKSMLTDKQATYVELRASGANKSTAIKAAYGQGSTGSDANRLEANPKVTAALVNERAKNAYMLGLTRESVLQGIMDAINDAKVLADPVAQIAGWREIAKICGFNAPEVRRIELNGPAKKILDRMQALSDEDLLRIANADDVIDVEAKESD